MKCASHAECKFPGTFCARAIDWSGGPERGFDGAGKKSTCVTCSNCHYCPYGIDDTCGPRCPGGPTRGTHPPNFGPPSNANSTQKKPQGPYSCENFERSRRQPAAKCSKKGASATCPECQQANCGFCISNSMCVSDDVGACPIGPENHIGNVGDSNTCPGACKNGASICYVCAGGP